MCDSGSELRPDLFLSRSILSAPAVIVAVSGGGDSTALLLKAKSALGGATKLVAVTVDHGLRDGSAAEAASVAGLCRSIGIEHRTATWSGAKPATGLAAAARLARHRLLADTALQSKSSIVLTGHTADDQAETVLMRQRRGEGLGLAGIAPATLFDGKVWFARPLLGTRRASLQGELKAGGIDWINDPTNENADFERVRARKGLAEAGTSVFAELTALAEHTARSRVAMGAMAAAMIRSHAQKAPDGLDIDHAMLSESRDAAVYALRILLATVGGTEHLPDLARSEALFDRLTAGEAKRFSLSRVVVSARKAGISLRRERRALHTSGMLQPGALAAMRSPWALFLPSFDYQPAFALAGLLGETPPPALPWP